MNNQIKYMTIGFFILMLFSVFSSMVESIFFADRMQAYQLQLSQRFEANVWLLMMPLIVAPVFEEWLFRKVILSKLEKKLTFEMSNIISAFLFAVAHLNWFLLSYFLNGLVYGWVMKKNDNLYSVIILHGVYNLVAVLTFVNI